jgi:hypothetical protein
LIGLIVGFLWFGCKYTENAITDRVGYLYFAISFWFIGKHTLKVKAKALKIILFRSTTVYSDSEVHTGTRNHFKRKGWWHVSSVSIFLSKIYRRHSSPICFPISLLCNILSNDWFVDIVIQIVLTSSSIDQGMNPKASAFFANLLIIIVTAIAGEN